MAIPDSINQIPDPKYNKSVFSFLVSCKRDTARISSEHRCCWAPGACHYPLISSVCMVLSSKPAAHRSCGRMMEQTIYCYLQFVVIAFYCIYMCMTSVHRHCWLGGRKGIRPVKNWVVGCWRGCLSKARCRLAYGPADATATYCLLLQ